MYAAIKAGIRSFARTRASELRDRKIRVNSVSPGATDTPGIDTVARMVFPVQTPRRNSRRSTSIVPMGRYGTPEEVANAVPFLASDLSSFTTGPTSRGRRRQSDLLPRRATASVRSQTARPVTNTAAPASEAQYSCSR